MKKLPNNIFNEKTTFEYYKWKQALNDFVDISKLSLDIRLALLD